MKKQLIICIVDDDEIYQFVARKTIEQINCVKKILMHSDGEQAINFLIDNIANSVELPDVIFLDINMPIMDGWGFLAEYVKLKPHIGKKITIYMVTSSVDPADIKRAKQISEVSDYIVKPITYDKIKSVVDAMEHESDL
ncbi:MAG: response regulator [Flavobacterium sp.]|jgi:CheY-like chemotaxis protein